MHELSLACEVMRIAQAELQRSGCDVASLVAVRLAVGPMANVDPGSLRFMLGVVADREGCSGLGVTIAEEPVTLACPWCGEAEVAPFELACPRCGAAGKLVSGDALRVEAIEFETSPARAAEVRGSRKKPAEEGAHV